MNKKVVKEDGVVKVLVWDQDKVCGGGQADNEKDAYEMAMHNYRGQRRSQRRPPMPFRTMILWTALGLVFICITVAYIVLETVK